MVSIKTLNIALLGNANCGKTVLFNALTQNKQKVANYSGVTVEKKHGVLITPKNTICTITDLPGIYSLRGASIDEKITCDVVFDKFKEEEKIDLIILIIDATNIASGLRLLFELKQTKKPIIVALNMMDIAKRRGYKYNIDTLKQEISCEVIEMVAIKKTGITELISLIDNKADHLSKTESNYNFSVENILNNEIKISKIVTAITISTGTPSRLSDKIDKIILNPFSGTIILLLVFFVLFQAVFSWSVALHDILQDYINIFQLKISNILPKSMFSSLICDGIISGVGAVIVFIPQILTISLFIIFLEDSGYLSRVAFLMDRLMGGVGLNGKAFIPLLSSFACAIPGIIATRIMPNQKDRLVTILISPLMTCSARLPIYTLLISTFIPVKIIYGLFNLQGIVMFALYVSGIIFGLIMAFVFNKLLFKKSYHSSIIELPSYKLPTIRNVLVELIKPTKSFLYRAGTTIVAIMIILWFLSSYPLPPENATLPPISYSFVGIIGKFLQPLFAPIGFNWQIVAALIPGMMAREVLVSSLATIYAVSSGNGLIADGGLATLLQHSWTFATAMSLIAWYIFAPQCTSTLAITRRETNSWKYPLIMVVYQLTLAYLVALIIYNIFK